MAGSKRKTRTPHSDVGKYEFVSWDDENPNIWKNKSHVPNHQPVLERSLQKITQNLPVLVEKSTFACGSRVYRWGSSGSTWPQDTWKIVPLRNWLITPFRLSHLLADKPSCSAPPNINGKFETSHEYLHEKPYPHGSQTISFPISLVGS